MIVALTIFTGLQRRQVSCYWSGKQCLGYKNIEEKQEFCSYGDFLYSFCETQWSIGLKSCESNGKTRKFLCRIQNQGIPLNGRNDSIETSTEIVSKVGSFVLFVLIWASRSVIL